MNGVFRTFAPRRTGVQVVNEKPLRACVSAYQRKSLQWELIKSVRAKCIRSV